MISRLVLTLFGLLVLAGCGRSPQPTVNTGAVVFVASVDHPFFPLRPGESWLFEGELDGQARTEIVRVLTDEQFITGVSCTGLQHEVLVDGEMSELTVEWYAQDKVGNVWKFGETNYESDSAGLTMSSESWSADDPGALPWVAMPVVPQAGMKWQGATGDGVDCFFVVSTAEQVFALGRHFDECLEVHENPEDDDRDIILYAPGVGRVAERADAGSIVLVERSL